MYISKKVLALVVGVALMGVVFAALGLLYLELGQANADLREIGATLEASKQRNADLVTALEESNAEIVKGNESNTFLNEQVAKGNETIGSLNEEVAKANGRLAEANAEISRGNETIAELVVANREWETRFNILDVTHRSLQTEHERLQGNHRTLSSNYAALQVRHEDVREDLADSRWELRETTEDLTAAQGKLAAAERELAVKRGDVGRLTQRVNAQEDRIRELLGNRAPLLLTYANTARTGFLCTGSMDPAITCLDEMTWLEDFHPADVVVGATIGFDPNCWEGERGGRGTAHRVMAIEVRDGVHYYWPKGDNNPEADGCWVPEYDVESYLVKIHRNVRPANAELRRLVNAAKNAHNEAHAAYYALRDQHCERGEPCTAPTTSIYERLVALDEALIAAASHFHCWQQVAIDSRYPGHIPRRC